MSWDDDVIGGSAFQSEDAALMESWEDGLDEPILDSWDAVESEEEPTPKAAAAAPKAAPKAAAAAASKKKKEKQATTQQPAQLAIDKLDAKTRKELMKKAEVESDLKNASDLFAGLELVGEHPRAAATAKKEQNELAAKLAAAMNKDRPIGDHPLFQEVETKKDFEELRKALAAAIVPMNEKSSMYYSSSLAIDLIRDISKPMAIESIRQTVATLNILMKEKERQERQARLARVKGGTATGGAGKKKAKGNTNLGGSFKKDQDFDIGGEMDMQDFDEDDFM